MNRKLIWTLAGIMFFSLVGLIIFQVSWVRNSIAIKDRQFGQEINKILTEISSKIETRETVLEISNEVYSLNLDKNALPDFGYLNSLPEQLTDSFTHNFAISKRKITLQNDNHPSVDSSLKLFSGDTLIYQQASFANTKSDGKEQPFQYNELQDILLEKVNNKTMFVEKIVNKLLNYTDDINERIDSALIGRMIREFLEYYRIELDYEFAVLQHDTDYIVRTPGFPVSAGEKDIYRTLLFPNDVFSTPSHLLVYFPHKEKYLVRSLGFMGISSFLLTLIIVVSFSVTMYVVFRQKRLSDIKNDFVNNMTHELKTPISTISLASQMLMDTNIAVDEGRIRSVSGIIEEESKRLAYQVEKVLQAAIYDQGKIKLKIAGRHINGLIEKNAGNFIIQVNNQDGRLDLDLQAKNDLVDLDEMHISNVIFNLLDNAVKYSGKRPEIKVSTREKKHGIQMSVSDNGIGISKAEQKRIFEKFYRVPTGNIHEIKGFGLGLSYVKKIVEAHKGDISVESEPGIGSVFSIFLPFRQDKS
ncbi:MAG: HAMP domain-containing sensor histidine kinase [Bacteroidota bacterium]